MKLSRKGFMLAEVVVVSVVIATVLVTLFAGLNNVSSAYGVRNTYYDVDSLYVAMEINDILISKNSIGNFINDNVNVLLSGNTNVKQFTDFYKTTGYNVSSSYFVPYNSTSLNTLKSNVSNQTFKDYIDYLNGNIDFSDDYNYIIVVERENVNDKDECYYYALKLKY